MFDERAIFGAIQFLSGPRKQFQVKLFQNSKQTAAAPLKDFSF